MARKKALAALSRREREVMEILFRRGSATVAEIMAEMPNAPTDSATRSILRILVRKRYAKYEQDGTRYVYSPAVRQDQAREDAIRGVVQTFFGGSVEQAMAAMLHYSDMDLTDDEVQRLRRQIDAAREEGL